MKKWIATLTLALGLSFLASCQSGPNRLTRTWDDYVNQKYTESAWVHGALLQDILPIYPIVGLVMRIGDILFVNTYTFWAKDAWDNKGTGFDHVNPTGTEKIVSGYSGGGEERRRGVALPDPPRCGGPRGSGSRRVSVSGAHRRNRRAARCPAIAQTTPKGTPATTSTPQWMPSAITVSAVSGAMIHARMRNPSGPCRCANQRTVTAQETWRLGKQLSSALPQRNSAEIPGQGTSRNGCAWESTLQPASCTGKKK